MVRALVAHLQEALHKQLVYCVHVMSVGCYQGSRGTGINSLYMVGALLAHLQEALHKQLVACVRAMSVGCYQGWSES
jgi:hypothetical protein